MKTLHLTLSFRPGGRRRAIESLSSELRKNGTYCELACLNEIGREIEEISQCFDRVSCLEKKKLIDFAAVRRLIRLVDDSGIEVVHAHDAASQLVGALLRFFRPRLRLLMTFHRSLPIESATRKDRIRNALATKMCQAVVVGSCDRREHFLSQNSVPGWKVVRIPFGTDTNRFSPNAALRKQMRSQLGAGEDTLVLGAVGHFGKEKGIDLVLRAYAEFVERDPRRHAMLLVLGHGTPQQRREIEGLIPDGTDVRLLGHQQNVEEWMQAFDLFLHAPRMEAFGLVLIEAMSAALPIVATDVGGIPDIVSPEAGLLVAAGTSSEVPSGLASAITRLASQPELRRQMGNRGLHAASSEYNLSLYARRHHKLYSDLLKRQRPKSNYNSEAITSSKYAHMMDSSKDPNLTAN